ncbi:MAG: hypothetical protein IT211_03015 [Armatimonadetes bacterium]|nr:hypothetical protein [Armatimonadota bacterium]
MRKPHTHHTTFEQGGIMLQHAIRTIARGATTVPSIGLNSAPATEECATETTTNAAPADQWLGYGIILITNTIYQPTTPCTATPTIF